MTRASCKLYGIMAREAPVCVLFRRGPSKQVQVIKWNTQDDTFEFGQWLKGRIYERDGDLSPDGKLMVYFAADNKTAKEGMWTGVSRPPFLTALELWFNITSGGGLFETNRRLGIVDDVRGRVHGSINVDVATRSFRPNLQPPEMCLNYVERVRLQRDGWVWLRELSAQHEISQGYLTLKSGIRRKDRASKTLRYEESISRYKDNFAYSLRTHDEFVSLQGADWADFDQQDRVVYSSEGGLYVVGDSGPRLIADFSDRTFEPLKAPDWATAW